MLFRPVDSHDSESELLCIGVIQDEYQKHMGTIF